MIINFGSINIDHVYQVSAMPIPGETISAISYEKFLGGKGINQSIAIAKANGRVTHVGSVGNDSYWVLSEIEKLGVKTSKISEQKCATGHAIIFVNQEGENMIVIEGGANQQLTKSEIDAALNSGNPEHDWVLFQNETNLTEYLAQKAKAAGYRLAYSAAPFKAETVENILPMIDLLAVNEIEAAALADHLHVAQNEIPVSELLITKGAKGSVLMTGNEQHSQSAISVEALDTTGAGDTFLGSFLANYCEGVDAKTALEYAAHASALQVTRAGAATAIPGQDEVETFMQNSEFNE